LLVSVADVATGGDDYLSTFLAFAVLNVAFFVAWAYWDKRPRLARFELVWVVVVVCVGALGVAFLVIASGEPDRL
jgi:amino acid transporter